MELPQLARAVQLPTPAVGRTSVLIDEPTAAALARSCRACDATLFAGLQTVWSSLLSRLSGRTDHLLGVPFDLRDEEALEQTVPSSTPAARHRVLSPRASPQPPRGLSTRLSSQSLPQFPPPNGPESYR